MPNEPAEDQSAVERERDRAKKEEWILGTPQPLKLSDELVASKISGFHKHVDELYARIEQLRAADADKTICIKRLAAEIEELRQQIRNTR